MRLLIIIFVVFFCSLDILYASESWKPSSTDAYDVEDPRYKVLASYRKALVLIRVYSYIADRQSDPGDELDHLLTDFQEQVAAAGIIDALSYLKDYPDDSVASKILQFQIDKTAGVWPDLLKARALPFPNDFLMRAAISTCNICYLPSRTGRKSTYSVPIMTIVTKINCKQNSTKHLKQKVN